LWHGLHPKVVDGFTFTIMDTPDNQREFPQAEAQATGVGLPSVRACAILSLTTAAIQDLAVGPYAGKETGEAALLRTLLDDFRPGDLAVLDRCFARTRCWRCWPGAGHRSVRGCTSAVPATFAAAGVWATTTIW